MTWNEMEVLYKTEFPNLKIYKFSDSKFLSFLHRHGWNMAGITLYNSVYLKNDYYGTQRGVDIMRHEMQHVRDIHKWHILYVLSYALILPTVFSMRAFWEWRGYREDLKRVYEDFADQPPEYQQYIYEYYSQWVVSQFTGIGYFYMFPFSGIMYSQCQKLLKSLKK